MNTKIHFKDLPSLYYEQTTRKRHKRTNTQREKRVKSNPHLSRRSNFKTLKNQARFYQHGLILAYLNHFNKLHVVQRKKPKVLTKNLIETKVYHIMSKLLYQRMRRLAFVLPTEVYLPHHFVFRKRPLIFTVKEITSNHSTTHGTVLNESPRCTGIGVVDVRKSFKTHNVPSSVSQDKN